MTSLRFREDGSFRVLQMADVQDGPDVLPDTIRLIREAIREADPDLVVFTGDQIRAASCFLPLSENKSISMKLGTRHRAAIGLSEVSDAVVMVVSEETGAMSIAEHGRLRYNLSEEALIQTMTELLQTPEDGSLARRLKKVFRK